jgi:hypothetical protein
MNFGLFDFGRNMFILDRMLWRRLASFYSMDGRRTDGFEVTAP